jgi:ATP-dependent DNA ligase
MEAMLANKYVPGRTRITYWPVIVQAKLDGIRLLTRAYQSNVGSSDTDHGEFKVCFRSRKNKEYNNLIHLEKELLSIFKYLPEGAIIDGEMMVPGKNFNELSSIVRSLVNIHKKVGKVQYYMFDVIIDGLPYNARMNRLIEAYRMAVTDMKLVSSTQSPISKLFLLNSFFAFSMGEIISYHDKFASKGYEGVIIRKIAMEGLPREKLIETYYLNRRCSNILKYKTTEDEEGTIKSVYEGKGRELGCAIFTVENDSGIEFNVRMEGTLEKRREWFRNSDSFIGKRLTYVYQEKSEYGVPRFPVGKEIRDYE